jgi:hypothetical protein
MITDNPYQPGEQIDGSQPKVGRNPGYRAIAITLLLAFIIVAISAAIIAQIQLTGLHRGRPNLTSPSTGK